MNRTALILLEALATCTLGLMAGFFFAFAADVVPAMQTLDATTYISTQQSINLAVRNAAFALAYFGSALLPFAAGLAAWLHGDRSRGLAWLVIALVYGTAVFWVTRSINVPINNELAAWSAAAPPANWAEARDIWNRSNLVRTVAALLCFAGALGVISWRGPRAAAKRGMA